MINFNFDKIKKEKVDTNVVAYGEVTNHCHKIIGEDFELYKSLDEDCLLLKILNKSKIKHEEHKEIELLPNIYKRRIVREMDHIKNEARKVID
jgi:hypothetical protein